MLTQTYPFTVAADYTYDAANIEIVGGSAKLKHLLPGSTFHADYTSSIDGRWGEGILTGTATGAATVSGGRLVLTGNNKYVSYSGLLNADSLQVGCVRFKYIPNYSGAPSPSSAMFSISQAAGSGINYIYVNHFSTGGIYLAINNGSGVAIIPETNLGSFSPALGTSYEIELNWDITTGATRLFIDGVQKGSTQTQTGTRSGAVGLFRLGALAAGANPCNAEFDDVIVFSSVQHTSNYTPAAYGDMYSQDNETVKPVQALTMDALSSFASTVVASGTDAVKYTLEIDSVEKYWTGTAWASSSGYAQSNTAAEILANVATAITSGKTVRFTAYLHSADGTTTPTLDLVTIIYNYWGGTASAPTVCTVWGHIYNTAGAAIPDVTVKATLSGSGTYSSLLMLESITHSAVTDANGYWELDLVPSSLIAPNRAYKVEIKGAGISREEYKVVPNSATANYATM